MLADWLQAHGWEAAAVALGVAYLLLAMRESNWFWHAAFLSTLIYLFLFWHAQLPMESALQLYYLAMAVYGWWHWKHGGTGEADGAQTLPVRTWAWRNHVAAIAAVLLASLVSGALLTHAGLGRLPYLDSFTTWWCRSHHVDGDAETAGELDLLAGCSHRIGISVGVGVAVGFRVAVGVKVEVGTCVDVGVAVDISPTLIAPHPIKIGRISVKESRLKIRRQIDVGLQCRFDMECIRRGKGAVIATHARITEA